MSSEFEGLILHDVTVGRAQRAQEVPAIKVGRRESGSLAEIFALMAQTQGMDAAGKFVSAEVARNKRQAIVRSDKPSARRN